MDGQVKDGHTPGPWRYLRLDSGNSRVESIEWHIGFVSFAGGAQDANGRLLAAAPDLLNALRGLHDDMAEYARINNLDGFDNHWMLAARAAIQKATGGQHV